ncbi:MAG: DUF2283 domain-containing protein [Candidatus Omnitrophica bacterium]|nr:DUF2283 domain-containing protein [Candidatus Omnitrophota bacterium]
MRITYDKQADAMYIRLRDGKYECRVVKLTEDIALDFTAGEKLVGIEVLGASHLFKKGKHPVVELKDLLAKTIR